MIREIDLGYRWVIVYEYTYKCWEDDYYSQYLPVGIEIIRFKRIENVTDSGYSASIVPVDKKFMENQTWRIFNSFQEALDDIKRNKEENNETSEMLIKAVNNYKKFMCSLDKRSDNDVAED